MCHPLSLISVTRIWNRPVLGSIVVLLSLTGAPAQAETLNCTAIMSLPATISTQGIHCLMGNLATARTPSNAITITANNVTLDLNGFKLGGQTAGSATGATGIFSNANNVTVKNGIVRGFFAGIELRGRGAVVEDLLVDQNTLLGISVQGQGAIVRRNQVVDTGGSTRFANVNAIGIQASGTGSLVEHNVVAGLTGSSGTGLGFERGIRIGVLGAHSLVRNNFVTDTAKSIGVVSRGIEVGGATSVNVLDNTVSNMTTCIIYNGGTGLFAGNTVTSCDTNFMFIGFGTAGQQGNNFIGP